MDTFQQLCKALTLQWMQMSRKSSRAGPESGTPGALWGSLQSLLLRGNTWDCSICCLTFPSGQGSRRGPFTELSPVAFLPLWLWGGRPGGQTTLEIWGSCLPSPLPDWVFQPPQHSLPHLPSVSIPVQCEQCHPPVPARGLNVNPDLGAKQ